MRKTFFAVVAVLALLALGGAAFCQAAAPAGADDARAAQLQKLKALLQDKDFALEMAEYLDAAYYKGQGQTPPPFLKPEEETATSAKSVKEERIAINLAGFYALEAGVGYISERDKVEPLAVIKAVAEGSLPKEDMLLLARFANATWKASQPFRSLSRITRETFRPAALLAPDELLKDYVQVQNAAAKLLEAMTKPE